MIKSYVAKSFGDVETDGAVNCVSESKLRTLKRVSNADVYEQTGVISNV
jgi:hypothetical protein